MKKDFFGGGHEAADAMFSMCGAVRCEDLDNCWACRGEHGPPTAAAAASVAAGGAASASVCKDPRVRTGRCGCESTVIEDEKTEGDEAAMDEIASPPPVSAAAGWGYQPENGPLTWHHQYPTANGRRQSPVDLCEKDLRGGRGGPAAADPLPPLFTCFQPAAGLHVYNTGASWLVNWLQEDPETGACVLRGGPLAGEYRLLQMHAHWGAEPGRGSEHTLEGRSLDGELHLVFYNAEYSPAEAMEMPDGLAVVGVFLREGTTPHPEMDKITRQLAAVRMRGSAAGLDEELNPGALLPTASQAYFTYPGSLTTPPLFESVTWLVMREPVELSKAQMDMMRGMRFGAEEESACMVDNFRPPCCLAGRQLRASTA